MKFIETALPGVLLIERKIWGDERGFLIETFRAEAYAEAGIPGPFVLDLHTRSKRGTVRGLHFQHPGAQGKLVEAVRGAITDVIVDVRKGSPTFGQWLSVELSEDNHRQVWIPTGFAHGFCVTSEGADVLYKLDALFAPESARRVRWNDPAIGIKWPIENPTLSPEDAAALPLAGQAQLPSFD